FVRFVRCGHRFLGAGLRREEAACAAQKAIRAEPEIIGPRPGRSPPEPRSRRDAQVEWAPAASVAQWIEYCPPKAGVAGSIPAGRATPPFVFGQRLDADVV